jgi:hypothetical protein
MRFEHLVQINDPLNPLLEPLTAAQLWRGLVLRAEQPTQFVLGLTGFMLRGRLAATATRGETLTRELDFGSFVVHDRVELTPPAQTLTATAAGPTWPASTLTIRIESPQAEELLLRFIYAFDEAAAASELDLQTEQLRREAYKAADIDTVGRIRELARLGELG